MLRRLLFLFHWVGFICLLFIVGMFVYALVTERPSVEMVIAGLLDLLRNMLNFDNSRNSDADTFWILWLAVAHWPIKWMLSGDKAFWPWSKG